DVKSGGYSAEFCRATGGIVNQTTKSGSIEFFAAAHAYWQLNFLRGTALDLETCDYEVAPTFANPTPPLICSDRTNRKMDRVENRSLVLEAGGPLVKDQLFIYGLVEFRKNSSLTVDRTSATAFERNSDDPFWGVKVDAY